MEKIENKFNITETIRNIRKAQEELRQAVQREGSLCTPILTDYDLIPTLHQIFCDLSQDVSASSVDRRKMFIFIIQYLYAPRNLFGYKMPRGLRKMISKVVNLYSVSPISRGAYETMHHYQVYSQFRNEVNRIFDGMVERMREEGILKQPTPS